MTPSIVRLDAEMVKALAHPLRSRILAVLRREGPLTSSGLASELGTNTGATSYHARRLAEVGLVAEVAGKGTNRERWWKASHDISSWSDTDFDSTDDARVAADWLIRHHHRTQSRHIEQWHDIRTEWSQVWRRASDQSDYQLSLSATSLSQLNERVRQVIDEFRDRNEPDAESVTILYYSYPSSAAEL